MKQKVYSESHKYERLVGHHFKKVEQLYDGETLQFYVKRGIIVETVHALYQFEQTD